MLDAIFILKWFILTVSLIVIWAIWSELKEKYEEKKRLQAIKKLSPETREIRADISKTTDVWAKARLNMIPPPPELDPIEALRREVFSKETTIKIKSKRIEQLERDIALMKATAEIRNHPAHVIEDSRYKFARAAMHALLMRPSNQEPGRSPKLNPWQKRKRLAVRAIGIADEILSELHRKTYPGEGASPGQEQTNATTT